MQEFGFTAHIGSRGEEARAIRQEAGFRARRWVVERTQELDESVSAYSGALGETRRHVSGYAAHRLRPDHLARCRPIEIGSKPPPHRRILMQILPG